MPVVLMTAFATVQTAVEAMKLGAYDYIQKPFDGEEIKLLVDADARAQRLLWRTGAADAWPRLARRGRWSGTQRGDETRCGRRSSGSPRATRRC